MSAAKLSVALAIACALVGAGYAVNIGFGFLGDARFLLEHNAYLRDVSTWSDQLSHDYFWSSSGNTIPYWRPWTKLSWLLEHQLLGGSAAAYHAVQVGLHVAAAALVAALAVTIGGGPIAAACAALLFGLGPAAIEPVSLLMARSDVAAALWSVAALVTWRRWLTGGTWWGAAHVVCLVGALGTKETCVVLLPAMALWGLAHVRFQGAAMQRVAFTLVPAVLLVVTMLALRSMVLADRPGPQVALDPWRIWVGGGRYLAALAPTRLETGLRNVGYDEAASLGSILAATVAIAAYCTAVFGSLRHRDADAFGILMWLAGTIAPVLLVEQLNVPNVDGKFALADRWLLQASAAASVLYAARWSAIAPSRVAPLGPAVVALWTVASLLTAPNSHGMYATEIALLDKEDIDFASIPEAYRSSEDTCRFLDRQVVRAVAKRDWKTVLAATEPSDCPPDTLRQFNRLSALSAIKRWDDAERLATKLLAIPSRDTRHVAMLVHLRGRARLHNNRPGAAAVDLRRARQMGLTSCALLQELAVALGRSGEESKAQATLRQARECVQRRP